MRSITIRVTVDRTINMTEEQFQELERLNDAQDVDWETVAQFITDIVHEKDEELVAPLLGMGDEIMFYDPS